MPKRYMLPILAIVGVLAAIVIVVARRTEQSPAMMNIADLKQLSELPGAEPSVRLAYGERLARANRPEEAQHEFVKAARVLEPGQKDATAEAVYARLGYALAYKGDAEAAGTYLDRARDIRPDDWLVRVADATLLVHERNAKQAVGLCKQAIAARPSSYEAHYILGLAYNDLADPASAVAELKAAVSLAPEFVPAQAELGHAYAYQSEYDKAVDQFRIARRLAPASRDYLFALGEALGLRARRIDEYREAADVQQECLKYTPRDGALLFTLGQLHLRFMNLDAAFECLQRAARFRPNHANTWYNLGRAAALRGDAAAAAADNARFDRLVVLHDRAIQAAKRVSAHPRDVAASLDLARAYRAEGNLNACFTQLKAAVALAPDNAAVGSELAGVTAELHRAEQGGTVATHGDPDTVAPSRPGGGFSDSPPAGGSR